MILNNILSVVVLDVNDHINVVGGYSFLQPFLNRVILLDITLAKLM